MRYSHYVRVTNLNEETFWHQKRRLTLYPDFSKDVTNNRGFRTAEKVNRFLRGLAQLGFVGLAYVYDVKRNKIFVVPVENMKWKFGLMT